MKNRLLMTIITLSAFAPLAHASSRDNTTQTDESCLNNSASSSSSSSSDESYADLMEKIQDKSNWEEYKANISKLITKWHINPDELGRKQYNGHYRPVLQEAIEKEDIAFIKLLFTHGVNPNSEIIKNCIIGYKKDCYVYGPCNNVGMLNLFLKFGTRFNTPQEKMLRQFTDPAHLSLLIKLGAAVDSHDKKGYTFLHKIARDTPHHSFEQDVALPCIPILLRNGASITKQVKHGRFKRFNVAMFIKRRLDKFDAANEDDIIENGVDAYEAYTERKLILEDVRLSMKDSYAKSHPLSDYNELEKAPAQTLEIDSQSSSDDDSASDSEKY